jgi:hypothetical protein
MERLDLDDLHHFPFWNGVIQSGGTTLKEIGLNLSKPW